MKELCFISSLEASNDLYARLYASAVNCNLRQKISEKTHPILLSTYGVHDAIDYWKFAAYIHKFATNVVKYLSLLSQVGRDSLCLPNDIVQLQKGVSVSLVIYPVLVCRALVGCTYKVGVLCLDACLLLYFCGQSSQRQNRGGMQ